MLPFAAVELMARQSLLADLTFIPQMITSAFPALESAAVCCLLFLLIRLLGRFRTDLSLSRRVAMGVAGITGVATQIWPSSHTLFADNSTAFLLTFTIYALARFRPADANAGWAIAAWAAALMVLCKSLFFLACPALVAYGYWAAMECKQKGHWTANGKLLYLIIEPAWRWIDQPLSIGLRRMRQIMLALLIVASLGVQTLGLLIHPGA